MTPLGFFFGIAGTTYALLAMLCTLPWVLGKASSTGWLGRRFSRHFAAPDAWRRLGRYVGLRVWLWSMPVLGAGISAFFLSPKKQPWVPALIIMAPLLLMAAAFQSYRYARRLSAEAPPEGA